MTGACWSAPIASSSPASTHFRPSRATPADGSTLGAELTSHGSLNARIGDLLRPGITAHARSGRAFGGFEDSARTSVAGHSGAQNKHLSCTNAAGGLPFTCNHDQTLGSAVIGVSSRS